MRCARPAPPRTTRTRTRSGSRWSPTVTPAPAPLVVEPASRSAGRLDPAVLEGDFTEMVRAGSRARRPLLALAVAVGIALAATPTLGHHSRAMFDMGKNITYRGVVEEYRWQNPHSQIVVRVGAGAADGSTVGTWTVEASAINLMISRGWTPKTYKPGDPITVVAHPNMDGSNLVLLFYAIKADGTRLYRAAHRYDGEKE